MDIKADFLLVENLDNWKKVNGTAAQSAALVYKDLIDLINFDIVQQLCHCLTLFYFFRATYLFGESFHYIVAHTGGILFQFHELTVIILPCGWYSRIYNCFRLFHNKLILSDLYYQFQHYKITAYIIWIKIILARKG